MEEQQKSYQATKIFLMIECLLYVVFLCCDLFFHVELISSILKYISITLCFIMAIVLFVQEGACMDRLLIVAAMTFTVIADIFLLFTTQYTYGVISFFFAQCIYLVRCVILEQSMKRMMERVLKKRHTGWILQLCFHLILRVAISALVLVVLYSFGIPVDLLLVVTCIYFISFVCNIGLVIKLTTERYWFTKPVHIFYFLIGMCLFLLCDIQVGLNNIAAYTAIPSDTLHMILQVVGVGMWACYLPSQILIVLSGRDCANLT